jgi:hypothetical protein
MSTAYHASRAKRDADPVLAKVAKAEAAELQYRLDLHFVAANRGIGLLMRKGKPVFYVTSPVYRESKNPRDLVA